MTEPTNSLTAHVAPLDAGEHVAAAAFLGDEPALALAGGAIKLSGRDVVAHPEGAILCAVLDGDRLITGGDDGRVVATSAAGAEEIADEKGKWIDALAAATARWAGAPERP